MNVQLAKGGQALVCLWQIERRMLKAAAADDISQVKDLLDEGLDVNGKNNNGWSALMIAASQGNLEMLKMLIEKGAAVDEKNAQGQPPLIFAARWGHADIVRLLIEQGVNLDLKMKDGWKLSRDDKLAPTSRCPGMNPFITGLLKAIPQSKFRF